MRQPLALLLTTVLLVASVIGCVGCSVQPATTQPAPAQPKQPDQPAPKPAPLVKIKLLLFTMNNCSGCLSIKIMLGTKTAKDALLNFDLEEVKYPDPRCREYDVTSFPALFALTEAGPVRYQGETIGQFLLWLDEVGPKTPAQRVIGAITEGGPVGPGGVEVDCDLPVELRHKNIGGTDGAGCCPFASVQHSARMQNERRLWNFLEDVAKANRGGGWPDKMDRMMKKYGHGAPYIQYEGKDPSILELALRTGRMPAVTYSGRDPHYRGMPIAHMVSLVYLSKAKDLACVLDNNFIGERQLMWMSHDEFMSRWCGRANGWAVILLACRPPLPPHN